MLLHVGWLKAAFMDCQLWTVWYAKLHWLPVMNSWRGKTARTDGC